MRKRIAFIGDGATGKTTLIQSTQSGLFKEDLSNISSDYDVQFRYNDNLHSFVFCDTDGEDEKSRMRLDILQEADAVVVAFSAISPYSFEHVRSKWMNEVRRNAKPGTPIVLVATRIDLRDNEEAVERLNRRRLAPISFFQGSSLQREIEASAYVECSAVTMSGIEDLLLALCDVSGISPAKKKKGIRLFKKKKKTQTHRNLEIVL
eukprot:TRINITY_DN12410_c0_g1_i1.p1 TRINITY_DN12410_c0_g1~~TRINITY_DN12410_c0_g1_i1.p1  ORF type:complete len:214 (-),score=44.61 TRINITY_DN12410_c0_g1_i1:31-648(-)